MICRIFKNIVFIMQGPSEKDYQELSLDQRAYRFFPSKQQEKTSFDKKGTRFFFYGQIQHDEYEKRKMDQFFEYIKNQKLDYNRELFDNQKVLLFLSGNSYKPEKTLQAMKNHEQFRKTYLPATINPQVQKVMVKYPQLQKSGYFYVCGRDFNFRPILVFNAKIMDFKAVDLYLRATIFAHEVAMQKCFIPGQVESWIIIYDLGGMGITQIPMGTLKTVLGTISSNYGGKLFKLFMVNAPSTIYFSWKIVSGFLDPVTVEKINISKKNTDQKIFKCCDPSQVQEKYGGKQPNRTEFWPYRVPQGVFDEKRLISDKQYEEKLNKKQLERNQIDPKYKK